MLAAILLCSLTTIGRAQTSYDWSASQTNPASGGSGTWDLTSSNWLGPSGYVAWPNTGYDNAVFQGTPGTITLGADGIDAGQLSFQVDGDALASGGHTLNSSGNGNGTLLIDVAQGAGATILAPVNGGLTVGAGQLTLSGKFSMVAPGHVLSVGTTFSALPASVVINGASVTVPGGDLNPGEVYADGPSGTALTISGSSLNGAYSVNIGSYDYGSLTVQAGSTVNGVISGRTISRACYELSPIATS